MEHTECNEITTRLSVLEASKIQKKRHLAYNTPRVILKSKVIGWISFFVVVTVALVSAFRNLMMFHTIKAFIHHLDFLPLPL